jgi:DNA end-binding protein Ku
VLDLTALLRSSLGKAGSEAPASAAKEKYRGGGKSCKSCKSARDPDNAQAPKASVKAPAKRSTSNERDHCRFA